MNGIKVEKESVSVDVLIQRLLDEREELYRQNDELRCQNKELRAQVAQLEQRCSKLEEKLNTNSKNSSKPPSQDPYRKRKSRRSSGKKQGGQPGHKGHQRELVPLNGVAEFHEVFPEQCPHCGCSSFDEQPLKTDPRQVFELPEISPLVIQYNIHSCACANCRASVTAEIPQEALKGFGPRIMGLVSVLTGELGITKRKVTRIMAYLNIRMSLGSVANIHKFVSEILVQPYEDIRERIHKENAVNADETSWALKGQREWLWLATSKECTLFRIDASRSNEAFQKILGSTFLGTLTTDRYSVYNQHQGKQQKCWSHLDRDFEKIGERSSPDDAIGQRLLEETDDLFRMWRAFKNGLQTRQELQLYMEVFVQPAVKALLTLGYIGEECSPKTSRTCKNLLNHWDSLWVYLYEEEVEPTNNKAERELRPAVIFRKVCYGSQSEWGKRFIERTFSVIRTLKKQAKCAFEYLVECFHARSRDRPLPSIF